MTSQKTAGCKEKDAKNYLDMLNTQVPVVPLELLWAWAVLGWETTEEIQMLMVWVQIEAMQCCLDL